MKWNQDGFLIPEVNLSTCINCGLCTKQCIALEEKSTYTDDISSVVAYGGWNKDDNIHWQSSSGGIFTAVAQSIIKQGGVIYGVVWKNKTTAIFDSTETIEGLARMRGSKYTPAIPNNVYRDVRESLKSGREVLFSGTPCQVHALHKYLHKSYDNLLTIDIVCHGVPSHLILEQYITQTETTVGKTIKYLSFRDKPEGWKRFHVTRHYTDGYSDSTPLDQDIYMRMFLCDKALNTVCYNCPYAHIPRQGDITLGDYWGVEHHHRDWPLDKGVSTILANTNKGATALERLHSELELNSEPFEKIYNGQAVVYVRPIKEVPKIRPLVIDKIKKWPLEKVHRCVVNSVQLGPIRLQKTGKLYKILFFSVRVLKYIKRKLSSLKQQ